MLGVQRAVGTTVTDVSTRDQYKFVHFPKNIFVFYNSFYIFFSFR